jgi:hypothetical protein
MVRSCRLALVSLCLFAALPAAAASLVTSFIFVGVDVHDLTCQAVNAGKKPLLVTIRVHRLGPPAVVLESSGGVSAGDGVGVTHNPDISGGSFYCECEVSGSSKSIRAVGIKHVVGEEVAVLPAH